MDARLPFGSRLSPFIFNSFADLVCWALRNVALIRFIIHYLDDFFWCSPTLEGCKSDMDKLMNLFVYLNIPLADKKLVGPCTVIVFLGIEIDSADMVIRLPQDKLSHLLTILPLWKDKRKCTKKDLLSLIGSLSFACKVVKPGRLFLRRLIDLSTTVSRLHHHVSINREAMADIDWWVEFLPTWNGVEMIQSPMVSSISLKLATDASGVGIGAHFGNHWFSLPLDHFRSIGIMQQGPDQPFDINHWELFSLVTAVFTWGHLWSNQQIQVYVDNMTLTMCGPGDVRISVILSTHYFYSLRTWRS